MSLEEKLKNLAYSWIAMHLAKVCAVEKMVIFSKSATAAKQLYQFDKLVVCEKLAGYQ